MKKHKTKDVTDPAIIAKAQELFETEETEFVTVGLEDEDEDDN